MRKEDLEYGERAKLLESIEILKDLDHPNICRVVEMFEDKKRLYFVNEYLSGEDLFEGLTKIKDLNESEIAQIASQIISAVAYLHASNIVHRDLKPENIKFTSKDSKNVKLLDFGTSKRFEHGQKISGVYGSSIYLAPEILDGNYNELCDEWSLGIILYTMIVGEPPLALQPN